jgi:hypothetical protein
MRRIYHVKSRFFSVKKSGRASGSRLPQAVQVNCGASTTRGSKRKSVSSCGYKENTASSRSTLAHPLPSFY